jgi:hypothetical protein
MNTEKLKELYNTYGLAKEDFFKHQHYTIVTRQGIEKIQAIEGISIEYEVIECTPNFAAVKAKSINGKKHIETFATALKGASYKDGNTQSWYVLEIAEKRALSRIVLRYVDLYKEGFFAEDESEEFKKKDSQ